MDSTAIYPIASFFNHSCDCNSTAIQADGSQDEITSEDIISVVEAEKRENEQAAFAVSTSSSTSTLTAISEPEPRSGSGSGSGSDPSSGASLESGSEPEIVTTLDRDDGNHPAEEASGIDEGEQEKPSVTDPTSIRIGQFRIMSIFAIKDITKGKAGTKRSGSDSIVREGRWFLT